MRWLACPVCSWISRDRALCVSCAENLYRRRHVTARDLGPYRTRSLFAWRKDDWPGLRWWALGLKQKEDDAFWREVATWMIEAFGVPTSGVALVPVPTTSRRNHALGLARAIAQRSNAEVQDVLVPRGQTVQHRSTRDQRLRRKFDVREGKSLPGRVLIIDDIITSGATAEAAFRALGQPAWCEVWCVMDRRPAGR